MKLMAAIVGLSLLILATACGSDGDADSDTVVTIGNGTFVVPIVTVAPSGTLTNTEGWPRVEGLRGDRYCEVLLARVIDARLNAEVWNTYGLNECPDDDWRALDTNVIKGEHEGVLAVLLNGPRYWLMDAIEREPTGEERVTAMFGALEMFKAATVDIGPLPPNLAPYTERHVDRETVFEYEEGAQVYELRTNDGRTFIMQSFSQQNDATLTEAALADLAAKIEPPEGWTFAARTLAARLRVLTADGIATVLQDELSNTYQLVDRSE